MAHLLPQPFNSADLFRQAAAVNAGATAGSFTVDLLLQKDNEAWGRKVFRDVTV
jgi:hypothetical protein